MRAEVVVVGGGISGLVCAFALQRAGKQVVLLEASERPGGLIQSERREGFLFERGPQSFMGTAALRELCRELGIESELIQLDPRAPRYILVNGALMAAPLNPPALLFSPLLSWKTKWSILREPFGQTTPLSEDESIADFVRRKFSAELLDRLAGPFVSGIYAGDPERLSVRSAFPQLYEAEKAKGSILRGVIAAAKAKPGKREGPTLLSFRGGNETLVQGLAERLGPALRCSAEVERIESARPSGFSLTLRKRQGEEQIETNEIVMAAPPDQAGRLLADVKPEFERVLNEIEFAPVAVVSLGYARRDVAHNLNGFGFLVPRSAGLHVLGTVWNSSLFPGRAPDGHVLLTSFLGGATDREAAALNSAALTELTHGEIAPLLGIRSQPALANVHCYRKALPQYNLGHGNRLAKLEACRAACRGLWFAGNYLRGPSIGACVDQALEVAAYVQGSSER